MKLCPWCADDPFISSWVGECGEDRAQARCRTCATATKVRTSTDQYGEACRAEAEQLWNAGHVQLPLTVVLPQSAHVVRRTISEKFEFPDSNFIWQSRFAIMAPKKYGIADHLLTPLRLMMPWQGYHEYQFSLVEGRAVHYGTRLRAVDQNEKDFMIFEFEADMTKVDGMSAAVEMSDTDWLKHEWPRPPSYDKLFEKLAAD